METKPNGAGQSSDTDVKEAVSSIPLAVSSPADQKDGTEGQAQIVSNETVSAKAEAEDIKDFLPRAEEDLAEESDDTPNVQKRINKLIAKNKELEEKLKTIEQSTAPKDPGKPKYSDETLQGALQKAMETQDPKLMADVMFYIREQAKDDLRSEYLNTQKQMTEQQKRVAQEWDGVVKHFSQYSGSQAAELYPGSRKDLDISSNESLLFKIASDLYHNPQTAKKYQVPNGQFLATADAFAAIVKKRTTARPSPEESEKLKRQLEREKMKNSFGSSSEAEGDGQESRPAEQKDKLQAFVEERKKFQNARFQGAGL